MLVSSRAMCVPIEVDDLATPAATKTALCVSELLRWPWWTSGASRVLPYFQFTWRPFRECLMPTQLRPSCVRNCPLYPPIACVYMDAYKIDHAPRLTANTMLFTVTEPVIDDSIELLERHAGFYAMLNRFREHGWKGRATEQLIASSNSELSAADTSASALFTLEPSNRMSWTLPLQAPVGTPGFFRGILPSAPPLLPLLQQRFRPAPPGPALPPPALPCFFWQRLGLVPPARTVSCMTEGQSMLWQEETAKDPSIRTDTKVVAEARRTYNSFAAIPFACRARTCKCLDSVPDTAKSVDEMKKSVFVIDINLYFVGFGHADAGGYVSECLTRDSILRDDKRCCNQRPGP